MNPTQSKIITVPQDFFIEGCGDGEDEKDPAPVRDLTVDEEIVWEDMGTIEEVSNLPPALLNWNNTFFGD